MMVRGRFERDLSLDANMPSVVVDGQEISWEKFGRMISSYEGWQFKLEILDRSDEVPRQDQKHIAYILGHTKIEKRQKIERVETCAKIKKALQWKAFHMIYSYA
jgi:hypothetical protein